LEDASPSSNGNDENEHVILEVLTDFHWEEASGLMLNSTLKGQEDMR